MKITEKELEELHFCFTLSSGPDVVVCYNQSTEKLYSNFFRKRNNNDIEIFRYLIPRDLKRGLIVREELKKAIEDFIPPKELRDKKINNLLNDEET